MNVGFGVRSEFVRVRVRLRGERREEAIFLVGFVDWSSMLPAPRFCRLICGQRMVCSIVGCVSRLEYY